MQGRTATHRPSRFAPSHSAASVRADTGHAAALTVFVFFLLCAAGLKNDTSGFADSDMWIDLALPSYAEIVKRYSMIYFAAAAGVGGLMVLASPALSSRLVLAPLLLMALVGYAAISNLVGVAFTPPGTYVAFVPTVSFVLIQVMIFLVISTSIARIGYQRAIDAAFVGLIGFSFVFIALNIAVYVSGMGYASSVNRFFGTTVHPNFLGVLTACCNVACLRLASERRLLIRAAAAAALAGGLFLQYLAGSRTGILCLFCGCGLYIWFLTGRSKLLLVLGGTLAALGILAGLLFLGDGAVDSMGAASPLSRNGSVFENNRSGIIANLLSSIATNPLFGVGTSPGGTANSYLRGWASYGLVYTVLQLTFLSLLFLGLARTAVYSRTGACFLSLCVTLALGAFFEGYLLDNFSSPVMLLAVTANFAVRSEALARYRGRRS